MTEQPARMADIAARLGISTVTVSKALSDKDGVSAELKQRILRTAEEIGYQRKQKTEEASQAKSRTVGIILAERLRKPEHSFYWILYLNVVEALKDQGYDNMLEIIKDEQEAAGTVPGFVSRRSVGGIIVLGRIGKPYLSLLQQSGLPLVLLDFYCDDMDVTAVITDSFWGGSAATRHLIGKGHRSIGFVGSIDQDVNALDRYFGFCRAMHAGGLPVKREWIIPDRTGDGFKDEFDLPGQLPTAFFCNNDQSAYHFTKYLLSKGYRVPEDISIIGFYDHVFSTLLEPKITTFSIDKKTMAVLAVEALHKLGVKPEEVSGRYIVTGSIVERNSVADLT